MANFLQALLAVVTGNVAYFLLMPHLPPAARHMPSQLDLGVAVDFWFCLVALAIVKTVAWRRRESQSEKS